MFLESDKSTNIIVITVLCVINVHKSSDDKKKVYNYSNHCYRCEHN